MADVALPTNPPRVDGLQGPNTSRPEANQGPVSGPGSFQNVFDTLKSEMPQAVQKAPAAASARPPLKFSNHAVDRMRLRGLSFDANELGKIQDAVGKASAKGAQNTLVLTDKSALVVSVKNNTVVTVMDKAQLKENVFTNIDSTVVI